MSTELMD